MGEIRPDTIEKACEAAATAIWNIRHQHDSSHRARTWSSVTEALDEGELTGYVDDVGRLTWEILTVLETAGPIIAAAAVSERDREWAARVEKLAGCWDENDAVPDFVSDRLRFFMLKPLGDGRFASGVTTGGERGEVEGGSAAGVTNNDGGETNG